MATQTPVGSNGVGISAPGVQPANPATVTAAAAQFLIEDAWKKAHPNQPYARAHLGGTVGGE